MTIKRKNKGFSLVELMIVIAVIAVLATFILIALQNARNSAENSRRVSATTQIRSFASVYYAINGTYENIKSAPEISDAVERYDENTGEKKILRIAVTGEGFNSKYCAEIELVKGDYFCVDESLQAVEGYEERRCGEEVEGSVNTSCSL
jgi:prepilin-type N-terminal cleavage/methylation domain-containing protein